MADMLRRIIRNSRLISVGVILQQNDQEEEPNKNPGNNKKDLQQTSVSAGQSEEANNRIVGPISGNFNEGFSSTYRSVMENVKYDITGWDRIKNLFSTSEYHETNINMKFVYDCAQFGMFFGFFLGGFREYVKAFNLFILTNDTTKFLNARDANKQLARVGVQAFLKGGLLTGPKIGILLGLFMFLQTIISEYRGKNGIIEFPIAGAITIATMKWNLGIRGMISGSVTGGLAGLILGPLVYLLLKVNGLTVTDTKYLLYSLRKRREDILLTRGRRNREDATDFELMREERTKHLPPGLSEL